MLEDDIQYIGTRMPPPIVAPAPIRPFPSPQHPVTAIILHVEPNGGQPACKMTFYRAQTSAVTIGRKSSSDHKLGQGADGPGNAGFSCQVVSGKHAKLAFSDSGYAYLIDLGSRHGTHILHPGETVSKMLDPEAATTLSNGDIITFGKTVGKGSYVVSPVTARVELLFGDQSENGSIGSANTSTRSPLVVPENGPTRSGRTGSGRYGLYIPSSLSSPDGSSEDDSSAKFDHDSDIEEITPPSSSHDRPVRHHFGPSLPFPFFRGLQAHVYEDSHDGATCFNSFDDLRLPAIDRPPERSRSHSPMDLSSPTPTPIGAWPSVVAHSPSANSSLESNAVESSDDEDSQESEGDAEQSAPQATAAPPPHPQATTENPDPRDGEVGISAAHQPPYDESRSPSPPSEFDLQGREKEQERQLEKKQEQEIHDTMVEVNAIVSRMHREAAANRGSYLSPIDNNPSHDELSSLAIRVADAENLSSNLDERLEVTEGHLSSLQEHVNKLQDQADALTPILRDSTADALGEVKAGVTALNALIAEMKVLYEDMQAQKAIMQVQQAVNSISVELSGEVLAAAATTEALLPTSRKRKRSDIEADEASSLSPDTVVVQTTSMTDNDLAKPNRKRARRIVSSVMHTAAAVTVGAVATWSALAFS